VIGKATIEIGKCEIRIETDCLTIIGDGDIALTCLLKGDTAITIGESALFPALRVAMR
jgi:hypothetical protein